MIIRVGFPVPSAEPAEEINGVFGLLAGHGQAARVGDVLFVDISVDGRRTADVFWAGIEIEQLIREVEANHPHWPYRYDPVFV